MKRDTSQHKTRKNITIDGFYAFKTNKQGKKTDKIIILLGN